MSNRATAAPCRWTRIALLGAGAILFGSWLSACDQTAGTSSDDDSAAVGSRITIVATTAMIADIVRHVAGDHASVRSLIGEGVDPHLYRPSRNDMTALLDADLVFYNGLTLEGKMADAFVQIQRSGTPVYAVTELIDESFLLSPEDFEGHFDPHVWMDPGGWINATEAVSQSLASEFPQWKDDFAKNAVAYGDRLRSLDEYASSCLASIPEAQRILITAHDAFNYFGRRYGLEVLGIQGISTDSEAGLARIRDLVETIVTRQVPAIFTETSVSDKNIQALIEGAKDAGHEVRIGGTLFSDAMGAPGTYEGTYIGMIDHNITVITRALAGSAPERGMDGKLSTAHR